MASTGHRSTEKSPLHIKMIRRQMGCHYGTFTAFQRQFPRIRHDIDLAFGAEEKLHRISPGDIVLSIIMHSQQEIPGRGQNIQSSTGIPQLGTKIGRMRFECQRLEQLGYIHQLVRKTTTQHIVAIGHQFDSITLHIGM